MLRNAGTAPALEILKLLGEQVSPPVHMAGPAAAAPEEPGAPASAELLGSSLAPQLPPLNLVPEASAPPAVGRAPFLTSAHLHTSRMFTAFGHHRGPFAQGVRSSFRQPAHSALSY